MQDKYVLPLVDISLLNSPNLDARIQVAQALDQACKEVGFLYLRGDQFQPALFAHYVTLRSTILPKQTH